MNFDHFRESITNFLLSMQNYGVVIVSGIAGFIAGFIRAKINGSKWSNALLEASVAFFICSALAAALQKYTSFDSQLICGICGVIGLYSKHVSERLERIIDLVGKKAENKIENYDNNK